MSKPSRTIRWDDPAYSVKSSEDSSSTSASLNYNSVNLPAGNLAIKTTTGTGSGSSTAVTSTSWRELKTRDGRPYYYNSVTQKTVWDMPQEYREYLEFTQSSGSRRSSASSAGDEEFWDVLRERRVTSKWTWEEALRAIITHPNYKCIPTLQERKASFQRYCEAMRSVEEEEAKLQSLALKESFKSLLASDPRITSDTKWSEVVDKHGKSEAFLAIQSGRERVQLFEEYQSILRRTELETVWERRKTAFSQITELLRGSLALSIDLERGKFPDWHSVKDKLIGTIPDAEPIEYLLAFEEYCHELLKEFQASRKAERQAELLKELDLRDEFKKLLQELEDTEQLNPFSTWSSIYPLVKDHSSYRNLVSIYLYGSSPIDMFYDCLDRIQSTYNRDRQLIADYFKNEFMTTEAGRLPKKFSSFTQFKDVLAAALEKDNVNAQSIKYAFMELYGLDAVAQDRQRINAYKHLLKHLSPPIKLSDTWEIVHERLKGREEYEAVGCEEDKEIYFLKFKKWLTKHMDTGSEKHARDNVIDIDTRDSDYRTYNSESKRSRWDKQTDIDTSRDRRSHYRSRDSR